MVGFRRVVGNAQAPATARKNAVPMKSNTRRASELSAVQYTFRDAKIIYRADR